MWTAPRERPPGVAPAEWGYPPSQVKQKPRGRKGMGFVLGWLKSPKVMLGASKTGWMGAPIVCSAPTNPSSCCTRRHMTVDWAYLGAGSGPATATKRRRLSDGGVLCVLSGLSMVREYSA